MRSGNWNSAYKGLQSRLTMGLFRLLYIAGSQRPVKIDELRHATTIWTPSDLPHRHWPSYRTKTICFVLVMFIYLIYVGRVLPVHNQLLDGYTRPHLHSTRPKDGWTGPWMRQCCSASTMLFPVMLLFRFFLSRPLFLDLSILPAGYLWLMSLHFCRHVQTTWAFCFSQS